MGESAPDKLIVMLVEDNNTDILVITQVLRDLRLETQLQVVTDGEAALEVWDAIDCDAERQCPALVLLDLNLPRVSGIQVLKHIRESRRCANIPVVIVTSSDSAKDMAAIRELKATAYFQKPADLAEYMDLGRIIEGVLPGG
jgi:CheY-like chemotaxis protein